MYGEIRCYQLTIAVLLLIIGGMFYAATITDSHRYVAAFNALENPSPSIRSSAVRELLNSTDSPLPNINPPTRLVIGVLLGDENASVRQRAALNLSLYVSRSDDEATIRRIVVALSRAMAEDPVPQCQYFCAFLLEDSVIGRIHLTLQTVRECLPYWIKASHYSNNYVSDMAKDMLTHNYRTR